MHCSINQALGSRPFHWANVDAFQSEEANAGNVDHQVRYKPRRPPYDRLLQPWALALRLEMQNLLSK
jgi:hypothetical protein